MKKDDFQKEIGYIYSSFSGVVKISGISRVSLHEVLLDEDGKERAIVIGFSGDFTQALLFDEDFDISKPLFRSKRVFSVKISDGILGRIIDGVGTPLDGLSKLKGESFPVFRLSPSIIERKPVSVPLSTGIKVIDATLPIGRGQRELIIGDRKLGKTTLGRDTILNQKNEEKPVVCIYVLIGKEKKELEENIRVLREYGALDYTIVVAASSSDSFASKYLAPFVGCTIGEYFRDKKKDSLIIYDDLTKHAKAYRDISLLLENSPGRESYPGDIFSLHAQLLERSANLSSGGSLTALPIAETQEGDITSFIPTNLISITDGQIYLERGLFDRGFIPAVNVGLSVSRVGSQAQPRVLRDITGGLRLALSQHKELQKLVQLETKLSDEAKGKIKRGDLILEVLKQGKHDLVSWPEQVILFYGVENGFFDDINKEDWEQTEKIILSILRTREGKLLNKIKKAQSINEIKSDIKKIF